MSYFLELLLPLIPREDDLPSLEEVPLSPSRNDKSRENSQEKKNLKFFIFHSPGKCTNIPPSVILAKTIEEARAIFLSNKFYLFKKFLLDAEFIKAFRPFCGDISFTFGNVNEQGRKFPCDEFELNALREYLISLDPTELRNVTYHFFGDDLIIEGAEVLE